MPNADLVDAKAGSVATAARLARNSDGSLRLESRLDRTHRVVFARDLLAPDNPLLRDCLAGRTALLVVAPSVHRLYGQRLRRYFGAGPATDYLVLRRSESSKSLAAAVEVCERAAAAGLHRMSPVVAVGGGVCTDICGLASALHHRGIPHINVPTTLIGLIDAGIGMKCAVNHGGRKSALGAFHPPEYSLLDAGFLTTLPVRHFANGLAEAIKLAVVSDAELFELLTAHATRLVATGFQAPPEAAARVLRRSVAGMLGELAQNPFETVDFRRKVDFGHTFSPYLEVGSGHAILHGEAVAMDIALSAQIACRLGRLAEPDRDRILALLRGVGLALTWPGTSIERLWADLSSVVEHRNGDLHLVIPTGIGACDFIGLEQLSPGLLAACHDWLADWRPPVARPAGRAARAGVE